MAAIQLVWHDHRIAVSVKIRTETEIHRSIQLIRQQERQEMARSHVSTLGSSPLPTCL